MVGEGPGVPLGVDRVPFRAPYLRETLAKASDRFKSPIWLSDRQVRAMRLKTRPTEAPIEIPVPYNSTIVKRFFNVEQLDNANVVLKQIPEIIDGVTTYGVDAWSLRMKRDVQQSNQWFTYPHGLLAAQRELIPGDSIDKNKQKIFVRHTTPSGAIVILVHSSYTQPLRPPTSDEISATNEILNVASIDSDEIEPPVEEQPLSVDELSASFEIVTPAEEQEAEKCLMELMAHPAEDGYPTPPTVTETAYHTTKSSQPAPLPKIHMKPCGVPFRGSVQTRLDRMSATLGLHSRIWVPYYPELPLKPDAKKISIYDHGPQVVVNLDHIRRSVTDEKRSDVHLSARNFRPLHDQAFYRAATEERGFKSTLWYTNKLLEVQGLTVKPGETPVEAVFSNGSRVSFWNEDQIMPLSADVI